MLSPLGIAVLMYVILEFSFIGDLLKSYLISYLKYRAGFSIF